MDLVKIGKFLSLILRHNPQIIGITLDENGWANVDELIKGMNTKGHQINKRILAEIVETNNKSRYSFNDDQTKIRANQGHSIAVDVELKAVQPLDHLYHGTAERFMESIKQNGLQKRNRNHVHLSPDKETALTVGKRHGKPIILIIDAKQMHKDGFVFYLSQNGVWLVDEVPIKYLSI